MKTIHPDYFTREAICNYRGETYSAGDNGAIYRHPKEGSRLRPLDAQWKFYSTVHKDGYLLFAGLRVHQVVATAFNGPQPSKDHIVDHIDTNRQNNRPENLRWVTRLENILLNPITARRVELAYGSIENFFKDPKKPISDNFDPSIDWMRTVTKKEADMTYNRFLEWSKEKKVPSGGELGEWLYTTHNQEYDNELDDLTESRTPGAVQRNWKTPSEFPLCPSEFSATSLNDYCESLKVGEIFNMNDYGKSTVVSSALSESSDAIIVLSKIPSGVKDWAVAKITIMDDVFIHEALGTFSHLEGAKKEYTLARGLEWEGGDTFDDYC
jgi:hypothetical protein